MMPSCRSVEAVYILVAMSHATADGLLCVFVGQALMVDT